MTLPNAITDRKIMERPFDLIGVHGVNPERHEVIVSRKWIDVA
jgi:hypothetical protein